MFVIDLGNGVMIGLGGDTTKDIDRAAKFATYAQAESYMESKNMFIGHPRDEDVFHYMDACKEASYG